MGIQTRKKYFSVRQVNRMLPLVRPIVRDILRAYGRLRREFTSLQQRPGDPDRQDRFEKARAALEDHIDELVKLGVELKSLEVGLVDFPHLREGREVYLCWKPDEDEVGFWHEVHAGFAGRQPI